MSWFARRRFCVGGHYIVRMAEFQKKDIQFLNQFLRLRDNKLLHLLFIRSAAELGDLMPDILEAVLGQRELRLVAAEVAHLDAVLFLEILHRSHALIPAACGEVGDEAQVRWPSPEDQVCVDISGLVGSALVYGYLRCRDLHVELWCRTEKDFARSIYLRGTSIDRHRHLGDPRYVHNCL